MFFLILLVNFFIYEIFKFNLLIKFFFELKYILVVVIDKIFFDEFCCCFVVLLCLLCDCFLLYDLLKFELF